jgi:hypothetical protein
VVTQIVLPAIVGAVGGLFSGSCFLGRPPWRRAPSRLPGR